ncbi:MAG: PilZ domain-containing protein [Desulfobulbaceae bacterium]|nr:PilZ domain-containing protein [Desulfobulbaceae bacterium]
MRLKLQISTKDSLYEGLHCKDISSHGIFVLTGAPLSEGTAVDVIVYIVGDGKNRDGQATMVNTSGKVIRVEKTGIAIRFDKGCRIFPVAGKTTH